MRGCGLHVGWRPAERSRGKIKSLWVKAKNDEGIASECLLTFIRPESRTDEAYVREMVGALVIVDMARDIKILRMALTKRE